MNLAALLVSARADQLAAEVSVEELLASLWPGWRPLFPRHRGWLFTAPTRIDVWDVIEAPAAVSALARAGFTVVVMHEHPAPAPRGGGPLNCACRTWRP